MHVYYQEPVRGVRGYRTYELKQNDIQPSENSSNFNNHHAGIKVPCAIDVINSTNVPSSSAGLQVSPAI